MQGAQEACFLAHDGEDEIGVWERQKVELLRGLAGPGPDEPAGTQGQLGLVDLVAAAEDVLVGGEEALDALDPVVGLDEIEGEQGRGQRPAAGEIAELDPAR